MVVKFKSNYAISWLETVIILPAHVYLSYWCISVLDKGICVQCFKSFWNPVFKNVKKKKLHY